MLQESSDTLLYTRNISVYVKYRGSISSRFSRNSEANGYLADPNIELHNR